MTTTAGRLLDARIAAPTRGGWVIFALLLACPSASSPPPAPPPPPPPSDASAPPAPVDGAQAAPADASIVDAPPDASGSSSVVLSFVAPGTTTNCSASSTGGAAIDQLTLSAFMVTRPGGTICAPLSMTLLRSGENVGSASSACPGPPATLPCPEVGDVVKIQPIEAGAYEVSAIGISGGTHCWFASASVGVIQGASTAQTLTLSPRAGCPSSSARKTLAR